MSGKLGETRMHACCQPALGRHYALANVDELNCAAKGGLCAWQMGTLHACR